MTTRKAARSLRRHGERARERLRYRRATPREGTRPANMLAGEYDQPLEVVAFNVSEGWSRDVSEDIARLVVDRARAEGRTIPTAARRFIEEHFDEELEPELCS